MYKVSEIRAVVKNSAAALPISRVVLVGSYAKNTATEQSDIDLVVDGADLSEAYWDFLFSLEDKLSVDVDLLTMKGLQNSCLRDSILDGGVVLYET
ncbi:MAG: nucleotidyltransferase domain-containing protein [Firmicutes bacterium]|nr:nucleotidyltransferase domain-containing protein [Bacillota bacterium]